DGIRDDLVTGVQTCALPISSVSLFSPMPLPTWWTAMTVSTSAFFVSALISWNAVLLLTTLSLLLLSRTFVQCPVARPTFAIVFQIGRASFRERVYSSYSGSY